MQTSDQGRAALKLEEGEVLKAYRDVGGVWTIGVGLTAASGVVKPVSGMVLTREQSDRLLSEALQMRYEPAVEMAMMITAPAVVRPAQHEFDAGVSFGFNTGAIARANWVNLWKGKAPAAAIRVAFAAWSNAGGKVLPALVYRRAREAAMLLDGTYRSPVPDTAPHPVFAQWGMNLDHDAIKAVFDGLRKLGYNPGWGIERPLLTAVMEFQRAHDLTVDGIIGRATLSTLQRTLDARAKATLPVTAATAALGSAAAGLADQLTAMPHADAATVVATGLWLVSHAWDYRDIVAASLAPTFPRIATFLRSF